jgi:hypothetical protein
MSKEIQEHIVDRAKNVGDKISETLHRSSADAEHARRDAAGDTMTASEKIVSGANEIKHRTAAELDSAKQKARHL